MGVRRAIFAGSMLALAACQPGVPEPIFVECPETGGICPGSLALNEIMARNDGAWIDEMGETEDWIEVINTGTTTLSLDGYRIADSEEASYPLPAVDLAPGETLVLWADGELEEGERHLPFRLSGEGETLHLISPERRLIDRVAFPELSSNDVYARLPDGDGGFEPCGWATPDRPNGATCGPPPPAELPPEVEFAPYTWPDPWPESPAPLVLAELALRPAAFVEVLNVSTVPVDLTRFVLTVSDHAPGRPWPAAADGVRLAWPVPTLAAGERVVVPVAEADVAAIAATDDFEGAVTAWETGVDTPIDRVDFMAWPEGAVLARVPDDGGRHRFCAAATPGAPNDPCEPLPSRPIGDRLRHLRTPGDFAALAEGETAVGIDAVKFVIDMDAGDVVHLLGGSWDLHYTFVREQIDGEAHLDRCDPVENGIFHDGWARFSREQYYVVEGRRYLLGTLVHHGSNGLRTVEFTPGDAISAEQMRRAFFAVVRHVEEPSAWALRPQTPLQIERMREIEGEVPIVDPNAPFRGMTFQALTAGTAYGVLRFVPAAALGDEPLGLRVIAVTDQVPNDLPFVGGLVTEAFQTPLSHVNVLSANRGTPNMALRDARTDPRVAPHLETLVRLDVVSGSFAIRPADAAEAEAFWATRGRSGPPIRPSLDERIRGARSLAGLGYRDVGAVGAKAALLAELANLGWSNPADPCAIRTPAGAFAVPLVHSREHYAASGAAALLATLRADPAFRTDPRARAEGLARVRAAILAHPVDPTLLAEVTGRVEEAFGRSRVRLRSSSNTEDLAGFNGAGLYTSASAAIDDPERRIEDALRIVWAGLYNPRAYDERTYFNVDEDRVAMGVLVHEAFLSERANGVAISRNVLDPIRSDQYYVNAQVGEASVTNPAPGITTEQFVYRRGRSPAELYYARSSLPFGNPVLSSLETSRLACVLGRIHAGFAARLDPEGENRWFAMDIEFKLVGPGRLLFVKQARPYTFGGATFSTDCREF
jgi:hypothetical protein